MSSGPEIEQNMYDNAVRRMRTARLQDAIGHEQSEPSNLFIGREVAELMAGDVFGDLHDDAYQQALIESQVGVEDMIVDLIVSVESVFEGYEEEFS